MIVYDESVQTCFCGLEHFTAREAELVAMMAGGLSNREIAQRLHLSRNTIAHIVTDMLQRVGARNGKELVAHGYASGVVDARQWPPTTSGKRCISSRRLPSSSTAPLHPLELRRGHSPSS
jgi:DNA-binding CsgD family transcriptional regulator